MSDFTPEMWKCTCVLLVMFGLMQTIRVLFYKQCVKQLANATFAYVVDPEGGGGELVDRNEDRFVEELAFGLGVSESVVRAVIAKTPPLHTFEYSPINIKGITK